MNDLMLIQEKIYEIRGQKVMLDFDLAVLYGVTTGNLNKAVKRNIKRFPPDFMFQLTKEELKSLKHFLVFQNGISNEEAKKGSGILRVGRGGTQTLPYAFTEQGLAMLFYWFQIVAEGFPPATLSYFKMNPIFRLLTFGLAAKCIQ